MSKIAIITKCWDEWGGSEELWARSIPALRAAGVDIIVYKEKIDTDHPRWQQLLAQRVTLKELRQATPAPEDQSLRQRFNNRLRRKKPPVPADGEQTLIDRFGDFLQTDKPNLVIVAQGINFDGLAYAYRCLTAGIPYVVIAQKAVEFYWPRQEDRPGMTTALRQAKRCFFVSRHNQIVTEEQFGIRLNNAEVILNPVEAGTEGVPYPSTEVGFRLACIGRLFILDKGQDILLKVLSRSKWRQRPLSVTFVGTGIDEQGIKGLAALLELKSVRFLGHVENVHALWKDYHGLVLPSRSEGLSLVLLEAMAAARVAITTRAGGCEEMVEEGHTGFIGDAAEEAFDQAMEKAWEAREHWKEMGLQGRERLLQLLPSTPPEITIAQTLISLLHDR